MPVLKIRALLVIKLLSIDFTLVFNRYFPDIPLLHAAVKRFHGGKDNPKASRPPKLSVSVDTD